MEQETLLWNYRLSHNWMMKMKCGKISSNVRLSSNWDMFVCVLFSFEFPKLLEFLFWNSKQCNFKSFFPVPYPMIYNPSQNYLIFQKSHLKKLKTHNYLLLHHHHRYPWNPHLILAQKCDNYEGHVCWISNCCRIDLCPNLVIENSGPKICTTCLSPEKKYIFKRIFSYTILRIYYLVIKKKIHWGHK